MKIKRISIIIYSILIFLSIVLFIIYIEHQESIIYSISLAFIPSTMVPLLIELPNMVKYKNDQINALFQYIIDFRKNALLIEYNIDKYINNNAYMLENMFDSFISKLHTISNYVGMIDKNIFISKNKNDLLNNYALLLNTIITNLDICSKKLNVSITGIKYNKIVELKDINPEIYAKDVKNELEEIKSICITINETCNNIADNFFNKKTLSEYQYMLMILKASKNTLN